MRIENRSLFGILLFVGAAQYILLINIAEALYPGYSVATNASPLSNHESRNSNYLLSKVKNQKAPQSPLFRQSTSKTNGLGRIRTGDLRRVKTEDLESEVFPVGEITTREASAPS